MQDHSAGPPLHASLASGALPEAGATGPLLQSIAQIPQPSLALWSTISSIASQIGGPQPSAGVHNAADAARVAMFLSQLAALQPPAQAAAQPLLIAAPPAYVAPRAEGATLKQPRTNSRENAALNRNDVCIPYSKAVLGTYSPYPQIRPIIRAPELCFECNVPNSHAGNDCPMI